MCKIMRLITQKVIDSLPKCLREDEEHNFPHFTYIYHAYAYNHLLI